MEDRLHIEVKGLDKLWTFKSELDIPLARIRAVRHDSEAASVSGWWHGTRRPSSIGYTAPLQRSPVVFQDFDNHPLTLTVSA